MRTYVRMVVCVHLPRFELVIAAGGPERLAGRALALAPLPGAGRSAPMAATAGADSPDPGLPAGCAGGRVGEVSGAAEARGVVRGMAFGEALARCPELVLVPADPVGVAEAWEATVAALESIGAAVEPARAGLAYFQADALRGLYGGDRAMLAAAREALGRPARVGAGPTRFCALAAALAAGARAAGGRCARSRCPRSCSPGAAGASAGSSAKRSASASASCWRCRCA